MSGRIITYEHNDNSRKGKAIGVVLVTCDTDFGANTDICLAFGKIIAMNACAYEVQSWDELVEFYPEATELLSTIRSELGEDVSVPYMFSLSVDKYEKEALEGEIV